MLVICTVIHTLLMYNTYLNGIDAMGQIPLQLLGISEGVIMFLSIVISGLYHLFNRNAIESKNKWRKSDTYKFITTWCLICYNIGITYFLAR